MTELCGEAGVPLSSGLNILRTLEANDYVRFEPDTRRYGFEWALVVGIGLRASQSLGFPDILHTYLVRLERQTQLTILLTQLVGESVLVVDKVEGSRDVRASASIGHLSPVRGVNAVAAPVFDAAGRANLAIGVLGLTSFLPAERMKEFGALVVAAGRQMTTVIGGIWPR